MKSSLFTLIFALVLGIVCAVLLTSMNLFTRTYREQNAEAERAVNFLAALEIPVEKGWSTENIIEVFDTKIKIRKLGNVEFYEYREETGGSSTLEAIAVPFTGPGLWGTVQGVLALEPDLKTIRGIRFYRQEETPGLGGEIGTAWFQDQFRHKQIVSAEGVPGFRILKPGITPGINSVDGITGATLTSSAVETMLNTIIREIEKERDLYAGN